jgi:choline dehydrogenase-like flavoprotein
MPETDVVVVGAGAGGLAAAWRLTTRGMRVTLLEAGRRFRPERDYPQTSPDFELRSFPFDPVSDERGNPRHGFGPSQEIEESWDGYRSHDLVTGRQRGKARLYIQYAHVRGVGGSTLQFQGEAHRYHPDSLRMSSLLGAGYDWPVSSLELERYYEIAERRMGVAAPAESRFRPRSSPPPFPAHRLSYASARLSKAFWAVGLTLVPNSLAILSESFEGRPPCNYCNSCTEGCPIGDKGSADVTFLPEAIRTGRLELRTGSAATRIEVDGKGRASGVVFAGAGGKLEKVEARFVVLAGGAVETPRLLLVSTSKHFRQGLANGSGQVGRNLTETLLWQGTALLPERVDSHRGVPIDGTAWDESVPTVRRSGAVGGFRLSTAHGAAGLRGPAAYAGRLVPGFGLSHQERMADVFGRAVGILGIGDWLPNAGTLVDLDPTLTDAQGLPVARITSRLGENERRLLREIADRGRALLSAAGAETLEEFSSLDRFLTAHVLGTCRMGKSPADSVSGADGFSHEVPNLAFADGSLVPSSGSGDSPSLTITALALRTADRLLERAAGAG